MISSSIIRPIAGAIAESIIAVDNGGGGGGGPDFILLIDTEISGDTNSTSIKIPIGGTGDIDWGDGNVSVGITGTQTHDYGVGNGGQYSVSMTNTFTSITYNTGFNDDDKLLEIQQWGTMVWTTMYRCFYQCRNMDITATDIPNISNVLDFASAFRFSSSITNFPLMDTSSGTGFGNMLEGCTGLDGYDFPTLDLRSMTGGNAMFSGVKISTQSWSDLLVATEASNSNNNVIWSGGTSFYSAEGLVARDLLTGSQSWTITDGGPDPAEIDPLKLLVDTEIAGVTASDTIRIPVVGSFYVDWGDGNAGYESGTTDHTYSAAGQYVVSISGFNNIFYNNTNDGSKVLEIQQWGDSIWITMNRAFWNCSNMIHTATDLPNTSGATIFNSAFRDSGITALPLLDTSSATAIEAICYGCSNLDSVPLIDTSSVLSCFIAFSNCGVISSFATLDLTSMTNGTSVLLGSTLTTTDYSDLLIATEANNSEISVTFHGGNSQYNAAGKIARDLLTGRGWTITDGGEA